VDIPHAVVSAARERLVPEQGPVEVQQRAAAPLQERLHQVVRLRLALGSPGNELCADGGDFVLDSSDPGFLPDLTEALAATGAMVGFDAIGGGRLAGDILCCMEAALNRHAAEFDRFGSKTMKRMFVYGGLNGTAIELPQAMGKAWTVSGWLLTNFLAEIGPMREAALKARVAADIRTVFASHYGRRLSLDGMLDARERSPAISRGARGASTSCRRRVTASIETVRSVRSRLSRRD